MTKIKIDGNIQSEHKNRFLRFTPTMSMGNIATVVSIIIGGTTAYMQMRNEVTRLTEESITLASSLKTENDSRKVEIRDAIIQQNNDRDSLYKKIATDHEETMADIKESQQNNHSDMKEMADAIGKRFDHIEDKLDRKADKK